MPTPDEELESLEDAMRRQAERARELGKSLDDVDKEVTPPQTKPDHANDGGVI